MTKPSGAIVHITRLNIYLLILLPSQVTDKSSYIVYSNIFILGLQNYFVSKMLKLLSKRYGTMDQKSSLVFLGPQVSGYRLCDCIDDRIPILQQQYLCYFTLGEVKYSRVANDLGD